MEEMRYKLAFYQYQNRTILYPEDADMDISAHLEERYRRDSSQPMTVLLNVEIPEELRKRIEERKNPRGGLYFVRKGKCRSNIISPVFLSQKAINSYVKEHGLKLGRETGHYMESFTLWYQPYWYRV